MSDVVDVGAKPSFPAEPPRAAPAQPKAAAGEQPVPAQFLADNQAIRNIAGGITRHTLLDWRERRGFPAPLKTPRCQTAIWDIREVLAWLQVHREA